jgi:hypothetical protein
LSAAELQMQVILANLYYSKSKDEIVTMGITQKITLDGKKQGRIYEGIGALSAGASSRLL